MQQEGGGRSSQKCYLAVRRVLVETRGVEVLMITHITDLAWGQGVIKVDTNLSDVGIIYCNF